MAEMEEKGGLSTTECKVAPFYKGSNIFITGGSGFVGIALIEKLLRTLDVGTIYVLLRQKKGVNIEDRLKDLCNNKVFTTLKENIGSECFKKLHPIGGDVEKPNLGISDSDQRLLENNVNIVFHLAACLDFGGSLRTNVTINLLGTRQVVQLCKGMSNLKALIHVSSAYVNSNLKEAAEVIYPSSVDVESLIKLVETKTDAELEKEEKKILKDYPNSYTLTKFLAEHEVANEEKLKRMAAIVRPSMITSAWKEPVPGWTISKNGPTGFFMGASKGVVRRLPVSKNTIYDYVPVDVVINTVLVAACYVASKSPNEVPVFHCTSSTSNPFRWADVENHINGLLLRYPLCSAIWYPYLKLVSNMTHFKISSLFVHFLPAFILDTIIKLGGGRPRLVRLHKSIGKSLVLLEPFIFLEWKFYNDHSLMLHKCLSANEQEKFGVDFTTLNWLNYFDDVTQGVRRYLHNEEPKTLGAARRKNFVLLILHIFLMAVIFGGIWYAGTLFFGMTPMSFIVPIIAYMIFNIL